MASASREAGRQLGQISTAHTPPHNQGKTIKGGGGFSIYIAPAGALRRSRDAGQHLHQKTEKLPLPSNLHLTGRRTSHFTENQMLILLIVLILLFGFGGYRMGPGLGYYGGGGLSLVLTIVLILLLLKII
jgi:hypothetical protein